MRKKTRIPVKAVLVTAAIVLMASAATVLAVRWLRPPDEIAEALANENIAEAFRSERAILIDKQEQCGDYAITLMGIAPSEELVSLDADIAQNKTYAVVAISMLDGSAMPEINSNGFTQFYTNPFINGVAPWQGGVDHVQGSTVMDGVYYLLAECDTLEVFADRGVYLGVSDYPFFSQEAFVYDTEVGEFSRNADYRGVNVLFTLPLDIADPERANELIPPPITETPSPTADVSDDPEPSPDEDPYAGLTQEQWETRERYDYYWNVSLEDCVLIEDSVKICTVDDEGYIVYQYESDKGWNTRSKAKHSMFANHPVDEPIKRKIGTGGDKWILEVTVLSANGEVTFMLYELPTPHQSSAMQAAQLSEASRSQVP